MMLNDSVAKKRRQLRRRCVLSVVVGARRREDRHMPGEHPSVRRSARPPATTAR